MKGYLFIEKYSSFLKGEQDCNQSESPSMSYAGLGWAQITEVIQRDEFLIVHSERYGAKAEAKINIVRNIPSGDNGPYQIWGGPYAGTGTFQNVKREERSHQSFQAIDNDKYANFFICHSHADGNGEPRLRWRIVVGDFSI